MKRYVCGFLFNLRATSVVLIRKKKPAWQAGQLNGVGGKIQDEESDGAAMVREFYEETGVRFNRWIHFATLTDNKTFEVVFFKGRGLEAYQDSYTAEGETVIKSNIRGRGDIAFAIDASCIYNLNWLIPLALDEKIVEPVKLIRVENGPSVGNGRFDS